MMERWVERGLALLTAIIMAAMVLWPASPRPEDLQLEVVQVRELPAQENFPPAVEVTVRWHWLRAPRATRSWNVVAVGADPGRWIVTSPSSGVGANDQLLNLAGQPGTWRGQQVNAGQDGEMTIVLRGQDSGKFYDPSAITLRVHYLYEAPRRFGWPGRSWVRTVVDTYQL